MTIETTLIPSDPVMIDKVISYIQIYLKDNLSWLNYSFGRAQKLTRMRDKKEHSYPGIYIKKNEYADLFPNEQFGNFSFFTTDDPQTIDWNPRIRNEIKTPCSLIIWYNLKKIYGCNTERNTEAIKAEVLRKLSDMTIASGRFSVEKIYEKAENIYKGYSLKEIDSQYLMQPYGGLRIEGTLTFIEPC